jgi:FkbM family methyltransferase
MKAIKRSVKRAAFSAISAAVGRTGSRRLVNAAYSVLPYSSLKRFHRNFRLLFQDGQDDFQSGSWTVSFAGRSIRLPLRREFIGLDWNTAISITGHETEIKETYEALLKSDDRPDVFLDIGANYGTHSLLFLAHGISTTTFEPNPRCHNYFRLAADLNSYPFALEAVALGAGEGQITLSFPEGETWLGSINPTVQERLSATHPMQSVVVPLKKLDDYGHLFAGKLKPLIKIDTEGAEIGVLQGARNVIAEHRPHIIFESNYADRSERKDLLSIFKEAHYSVFQLPRRPGTNEDLPKEAFLESSASNFIAIPDRARR